MSRMKRIRKGSDTISKLIERDRNSETNTI